MGYVKENDQLSGFAYVSASHNPIGHNGLKFGDSSGGVLGGESAARLMARFDELLESPELDTLLETFATDTPGDDGLEEVYRTIDSWKNDALRTYNQLVRKVATAEETSSAVDSAFGELTHANRRRPIGIIGELNGSARSLSIDREILSDAGFLVSMYNDTPGKVSHRIVPEGYSLDECRTLLGSVHNENSAFVLGYVPDNDGDRGNLVYYDDTDDVVRPIDAQQGFALAVLAELSYLSYRRTIARDRPRENVESASKSLSTETGPARLDDVAVVVNGPTSMRIERIANAFGARVFRTEVGEANVVGKARKLREDGYVVRILGEGSNGGTIIHPSSVRDPLSTIFAISKLLLLHGNGELEGPFGMWKKLSQDLTRDQTAGAQRETGDAKIAAIDITINDVLESLPRFTTTGAYEVRAIMQIRVDDHGAFKRAYENRLPDEWKSREREIRDRTGADSYEVVNFEGYREKSGAGNRDASGRQKGGLAVRFVRSGYGPVAYIWMRGSGTEPVFRILADVEGRDDRTESYLLEWQRTMIERAVETITG